jgi:hypothetical protein
MGAKTAAEKLGLEITRVYKIMNSFFRKFKGLKQWIETVKK